MHSFFFFKKKTRQGRREKKYIYEVCSLHTFSNFVSNSRKLKFRPIIVQQPLKPTSFRQTSFRQQRLTSKNCIFSGYTLKSFVKSFTSLALELWSMSSSSSLRWDILATPLWVQDFMDFRVRKEQTCWYVLWQLCSTRLAWSPFSLGRPGFPSVHLTNDLQPTAVLSRAPSLGFGLNYTQQKRSYILETCMREGQQKKKRKKTSKYHKKRKKLTDVENK